MHYLPNLTNAVRLAVLTMTGLVPSNVVDLIAAAHEGSGTVTLSGAYTGAVDAQFDVEIVSQEAGSNAQVTTPVFAGVGNGRLVDLQVDGTVPAQTFRVTLTDGGTASAPASVQFGPVLLRSKLPEDEGNGTTLQIDHSALVFTSTDFSTRADLQAGTAELPGEEWNFGAVDLLPDGTVPPSAPRIRLADDPQVYRHFRRYVAGRYLYAFSPAILRTVPAGSPVYAASGSRSATITLGATTESLSGITSLYDLLNAIRGTSELIEVVGVVANDLRPGEMGAVDLSTYTSSYYDSIERTGTRWAQRAVLNPVLDPAAPTQALVISCKRATTPGAEVWEVIGSASGQLSDLVTGVPYSAGPLAAFTVPVALADAVPASGSVSGVGVLQTEAGCVLVKGGVLGQAAVTKTLRFVYRKRAQEECDCESIPLQGGPSPGCLGVPIAGEEGETAMGVLADIRSALKGGLGRWADYCNSALMYGVWHDTSNDKALLMAQRLYKRIFEAGRNAAEAAVNACITEGGLPPSWAPGTEYAKHELRTPVGYNGFVYRCTDGGLSGSTPPTWPTTLGGTVTETDGPTWECYRVDAITLFRERSQAMMSHLAEFVPHRGYIWNATPGYENHRDQHCVPTTPNGHWYKRTTLGFAEGTEPTWPTDGSTVADGGGTWQDMGAYWSPTVFRRYGEILDTYGRGAFVCIADGTTGATEPNWNSVVVTDGTVRWLRISMYNDEWENGQEVEQEPVEGDGTRNFAKSTPVSYIGSMANWYKGFYMECGVASANFDEAGNPGTDCWQDPGDEFYWRCEQGGSYAEAFTNRYYHSVVRTTNAQGATVMTETREFGFQICACPEHLLPGDYVDITVLVDGGSGLITYQEGDQFRINCVQARPVELVGGVEGNNTLTWRVIGSEAGQLASLALDTTDPDTWDYSDSGVEFRIEPGAIAFLPGATWTWSVEGGQFKWRKNGGTWSDPAAIQPSVALSDGLSAVFTYGRGASFLPEDLWQFGARAINGADQLRTPSSTRARWTGSTVLTAAREDAGQIVVDTVLLADHLIASDATLVLQGSNDNFATTVDVPLAWTARHICAVLPTPLSRAKWRITCDRSGAPIWWWLGERSKLLTNQGNPATGRLVRQYRMPNGRGVRAGLGYQVQHERLHSDSLDALVALLGHASEFDQGRLAVLANPTRPQDVQLVEFAGETLEVTDLRGFQPLDPAHSLCGTQFTVRPAA